MPKELDTRLVESVGEIADIRIIDTNGDSARTAVDTLKQALGGDNVGQAYPDSVGGEIFNNYTAPSGNVASGRHSHAEGYGTSATGMFAHAEGRFTKATDEYSHAEGDSTQAKAPRSHAEGSSTIASGAGAHAEGGATTASGATAHAEGSHTVASGVSSHAEGHYTRAPGSYTHAEGYLSTASGEGGHAEGFQSSASGNYSHAGGMNAYAGGDYSHAHGVAVKATSYAQVAMGNSNLLEPFPYSGKAYDATRRALTIGNGTSDALRGDAFRVFFNGNVEADGTYTSPAADYAELFEWADGNTEAEDRVGRFVTTQGAKIRLAAPEDSYTLGVVSATPSLVGDNPLAWQGKYLNDEWGRPVYENTEVEYEEMEDGEPVPRTRIDHVRKLNPDYSPDQAYTPRLERPEWDAIGMVGKLLVRHDGSLQAGGFCTTGPGGVATNAVAGYYVMEVLDTARARVIIK